MYRYETHLHTAPVSKCAGAGVRETLHFYKDLGYDGVFITNHFLDGNVNVDRDLPYKDKLDFYFSDYYDAKNESERIGIKVFFGAELSYGGTDFLIYNLTPDWYYEHPEIMSMSKKEELALMRSEGAFIVHAHPFREAGYIDHIRLFPRSIDAVEVNNGCRTDFENAMADDYANNYGFLKAAGTDNHHAFRGHLAGMECEEPINTEKDYEKLIREGKAHVFTLDPDPDDYEWVSRDPDGLLTVHLRANPTTGYDWEWSQKGEGELEEESKEYLSKWENSGLCGAPSFVKFRFKPSKPGLTELKLRYNRSWENREPIRTFTICCTPREDGRISLHTHDFSE